MSCHDEVGTSQKSSPEAAARFKQARAGLLNLTIPELLPLLESSSLRVRFHAEMRLRELTST